MGPGDVFTATAILAATGWILYRSLLKRKGGCHGCSGCGHAREDTVARIGTPPGTRRGEAPPASRCGP